MDMTYAAQRALLDCYGPPSVVVNSEGDIIYVNGRTGKYLEPSSGKVNNNVFAMAREGLREEIGAALHNAATRKTTVTATGVRVKSNGGSTTINLTVRPLAQPAALQAMFLVVFEEAIADRPRRPPRTGRYPPARPPRRASRRPSWKTNSVTHASAFRPPPRKWRLRKRNFDPRTRSCSRTTRNCRAPMKN